MATGHKIKKFAYYPYFVEFYNNAANKDKLCWDEVDPNVECITTNVEIDEFIKTLSREKKDYHYTAKSAKRVFQSGTSKILRASLHDEIDAVDCFLKYHQHKITFNESVSRVVKSNHNINQHFPMSCIRTEYILPHHWRKRKANSNKTATPASWREEKHVTQFFKQPKTPSTPYSTTKLFIDTSAFLAKFSKNDNLHDAASLVWDIISTNQTIQCYTSNFVLGELFTLLAWRVNYPYASEQANKFLESNPFIILRPDHEIELSALSEFEKNAPLRISYTDCVSFALMRKHNIKEAFSFDNDFVNPGKFALFNSKTLSPFSC